MNTFTPQEFRERIAAQLRSATNFYNHDHDHKCAGCGVPLVDVQAQYCFPCGEAMEEMIPNFGELPQ